MTPILPATPAMAASMATLHAASFAEEKWSARQIEESLSLSSTEAWVALDGSTVIGLLLCQTSGQETEILTFCVAPAHRRQGLAKRLLAPILARPNGTILHLEVAADNDPARRLYESVGFLEAGKRPNYYKRGEKSVDAVRYVCNLNDEVVR